MNDYKKIILSELNQNINDKCDLHHDTAAYKYADIIFRDLEGNFLHRERNKVIVDGSAFTAMKHFNINAPVLPPNYNTALSLQNTDTTPNPNPGVRREDIVTLFCVGTGGCGPDPSQVYEVDYKKWIKPNELVPLRYPAASSDLTSAQRRIYFGRKVVGANVAYYFKTFDSAPIIKQQYIDGTQIDANIHDATKDMDVESFVELKIKITKEDCREFFQKTSTINQAKINTIELCTCYPKDYSGTNYPQNIRPLTKLNFSTESLMDLSKGLDITYHIFY